MRGYTVIGHEGAIWRVTPTDDELATYIAHATRPHGLIAAIIAAVLGGAR